MVVVAFQLYDVNEGDGGLAVRALKSRKRPPRMQLSLKLFTVIRVV
eukprot:COSAG06_NODE_5250_length_3611_cov_1.496583_1_plen_46_part_00